MRAQSYFLAATAILSAYDGGIPFASWLKNHFKEYKKFGSRDRKVIADLCFSFFRLGGAFKEMPVANKLLIAQFICHCESNKIIEELKPEWSSMMDQSLEEKLLFLKASDQADSIFPLREELSRKIDPQAFIRSFTVQPELFIRVRPGHHQAVFARLQAAGIPFIQEDQNALRLPANSKIETVLRLDSEVVVQDLNSQRVLLALQLSGTPLKKNPSVWDCCAASGGKSILAVDTLGSLRLTVSDIRTSILHNLRNRFERAGIHSFRSFAGDLTDEQFKVPLNKVDLIICDAPCSGSGTWSRSPEQLVFFDPEKIDHYTTLQKKIGVRASQHLATGGYFLYITCSVFYKENEEVVDYMVKEGTLKLIQANYYKGYNTKADTLFAALFTI